MASFAWRGERALALRPAGRLGGHPALARYLGEPGDDVAGPAGLSVLTVAGDRVDTVTRFHDPRVFDHAGLPPTIAPA